jgi:pyruvate dehydrogenase E2 component (dihydrolipoamide acetyltransferase)
MTEETTGSPRRVIHLQGIRNAIARKMIESLATTAQLSYFIETDAARVLDARRHWRTQGYDIGLEDIFIEALVRAIAKHPEINARASASEAVVFSEVHCSIAISLPTGVVAPTLFNSHTMTIPQISDARRDLVRRARSGELSVSEMTGGTITISNIGASRVRQFTPILNVPQVGIIGFGRIELRPWATQGGQLAVRPVLPISLTADHRFVDGEPAAAFLTTFVELLEGTPAEL